MHACITLLQSDTGLSRSSKFCFSLVQFTNRDVPFLLALLKAVMVHVFVHFHGFYRYLSIEINVVLE